MKDHFRWTWNPQKKKKKSLWKAGTNNANGSLKFPGSHSSSRLRKVLRTPGLKQHHKNNKVLNKLQPSQAGRGAVGSNIQINQVQLIARSVAVNQFTQGSVKTRRFLLLSKKKCEIRWKTYKMKKGFQIALERTFSSLQFGWRKLGRRGMERKNSLNRDYKYKWTPYNFQHV